MRKVPFLRGVPLFLACLLTHLPASAADVDPLTGPLAISPTRRPPLPADHPWACSSRAAVCVHADSKALAPEVLPTLRDLESVAARAHAFLRWPAPLPDETRGGNASFDVYLRNTAQPFFDVVPDDPDIWHEHDRTSAFAIVRPGLPDACFRSSVLAEAYVRAALYGVDAAANDALAHATAAFVASQAVDCPIAWMAAVDDAQASPQLAISNPSLGRGRGALLFPWFLQHSRGVLASVDLLHALASLAVQHSPPSSQRWTDEPDLLDILDSVEKGRGSSLDALLLEYAVTRAFVGNRDDGLHLPDSRFLGSAGSVRFDWSLAWSQLPRGMVHQLPIEPTGSAYVWLDLASAPPDAALVVQARWELPTRFRVSLLRIGKDGSPLSRFEPPAAQRETEMQATLEHVGGAAGLLIVICNVGPNLSDFAFDPDATPYTPSGYSLALYPQR